MLLWQKAVVLAMPLAGALATPFTAVLFPESLYQVSAAVIGMALVAVIAALHEIALGNGEEQPTPLSPVELETH